MTKEIQIVKQILEWNEDVSAEVKKTLAEKHVTLVNVMGSPGGGKTSLITALIAALRERYRIGVIEGDIAGDIDAKKIEALGIPVVQLQTDGACHIEAMSIRHMLPMFDLDSLDVLFVENIGNLVCPAEFNIGEDLRISILSVPEGDDKVRKYPLMFTETNALVINKCDMLPHFSFDMEQVMNDEKDANAKAEIFRVSTVTGEGVKEVVDWLEGKFAEKCARMEVDA